MNDPINTRAIEIAREALTKVEIHEKICEERYNGLHIAMGEIKKGVGSLNKTLLRIGGTIILGLLGILGYLFIKINGW